MDNLELALIRRVAVIDKIFYEHLNNNITIDLIKIVKLDIVLNLTYGKLKHIIFLITYINSYQVNIDTNLRNFSIVKYD